MTSSHAEGPTPRQQGAQNQCTATPANRSDPDLVVWKKGAAPLPLTKPQSNQSNFRDDTAAWRYTDARTGRTEWRMAVGASMVVDGVVRGVAAVYSSNGSSNFAELSGPPIQIIHGVDSKGIQPLPTMWECPNLFELKVGVNGDAARTNMAEEPVVVLKISAHPHDYYSLGTYSNRTSATAAASYEGAAAAGIANGDGDDDGGHFVNGTDAVRIDQGSALYAATTFLDATNGRRVMWAWIREEGKCDSTAQACSLQSLPRLVAAEVQESTGKMWLRFPPLPALAALRIASTAVRKKGLELPGDGNFVPLLSSGGTGDDADADDDANHVEIMLTLSRSELAKCKSNAHGAPASRGGHGLEIVGFKNGATGEETVVRLLAASLTADAVAVEINRTAGTGTAAPGWPAPEQLVRGSTWLNAEAAEPDLSVQVFFDGTVVEVFVMGGRMTMTARSYPAPPPSPVPAYAVGLRAAGCPITVASVEAHSLASIWAE